MTWLRWDTETRHHAVIGRLAEALKVKPAYALGHYFACCSGFGEHQTDGDVRAVSDTTLEGWALWTGKRGVFARAFRALCVSDGSGRDPLGVIRGWWRQRAIVQKQERDRQRPPSRLRDEIPPTFPCGNLGGNQEIPPGESQGGRRTEDGYEHGTTPSGLPARLQTRLLGCRGRVIVLEFLEKLPAGQSPDAWAGALLGCLDGMGLAQGRAATVDDLAAACADYLATPGISWGLPHFRAFVDRIVSKRLRPVRSREMQLPQGRQAREIEAAARFAAGGDE